MKKGNGLPELAGGPSFPVTPTFNYRFTEAEMARGWKLAQTRWRKLDWLLRIFGLLNVVLALLGALVIPPYNPGSWVLLLPGFYLLAMPWYRGMLFRRGLKNLPGYGAEVRWELADAVRVTGPEHEMEVQWSQIESSQAGDEGVVLRLASKSFLWLPWDAQVEGSRDQVLDLLERHLEVTSRPD